MLGHSRIGDCVTKSGLFAAGGSPFMMQDIGGAITRDELVADLGFLGNALTEHDWFA